MIKGFFWEIIPQIPVIFREFTLVFNRGLLKFCWKKSNEIPGVLHNFMGMRKTCQVSVFH